MNKQKQAIRREQAIARVAARATRTDEEQLALLVERGHPECAEAKKLRARINGE